MYALCLPEAFPGHVRRTVPSTSPQPPAPTLLPFYKNRTPLNPLESTLPNHSTTVHSKRLTPPLISFRCNTYKKTGDGAPLSTPKVCQLVNPGPRRVTAPKRTNRTHSSHSLPPQPQRLHTFAHSFRHLGGWGGFPATSFPFSGSTSQEQVV